MSQIHKSDKSTQELIIESTLDVIGERSIAETRMRNIAEKADIYQSNVHYYYRSKRDLLLAAQKKVADRCVELREEGKQLATDTLESQLNVFIRQKLIFIKQEAKYDYAEIDFWVQSRFDDEFKAEFQRSFLEWRKELQKLIQTYAPHFEQERQILLASIIISLLEGATIQYLVDSMAFSVDKYFTYCKELIIREIQRDEKE